MTQIKDGGPAFPTMNSHQNGPNTYHFEGMTLRDYFAAKAMQNYMGDDCTPDAIAKAAYEMADAMLRARGTQ